MRSTFLRLTALAATLALSLTGTAAAAEYHPSTLLVRFDDGTSSAQRSAAHALVGARVANRFDRLGIDVVRLRGGLSAPAARERYERLPGVAAASLNRVVRATGGVNHPDDTLFERQWGFDQPSDFDIDAPEGWAAAFGTGEFPTAGGTRVAVLDTGIDPLHEDLQGKTKTEECASALTGVGLVVEGICLDDNGHGTHVAGTVTANTGNATGVAGTAPDAGLAVFKFMNAAGVGLLADEIAGLEWAVEKNAAVVNMSFGYVWEDEIPEDDPERQAIEKAAESALLVAAAGNEGDSAPNYPAYYPDVMSVASSSADGTLSDFSTCNADVEIAAPGEDIWSTFVGSSYISFDGTSMAAPHVSGAAALVMSEQPDLTLDQVRNALKNSSVSLDTDRTRGTCPASLPHLNLADALGASTDGGGSPEEGTEDGSTGPGNGQGGRPSTNPGNGRGGGPKEKDSRGRGKGRQ